LKKRTKKLLLYVLYFSRDSRQREKSFLLLFFKKEVLAFLLSAPCVGCAELHPRYGWCRASSVERFRTFKDGGYAMNEGDSPLEVVALRVFLPAKDFEISLRFYQELGFGAMPLDDKLASMHFGRFGFLLQGFHVEGFAGNFMMQLMVRDVHAWWARIAALDLAGKYGVRAPVAPRLQPWGLVVAFVFDPSGVLWHVAQARNL
jgi:uncharacterized glyoxalase superfamily protein PhnB